MIPKVEDMIRRFRAWVDAHPVVKFVLALLLIVTLPVWLMAAIVGLVLCGIVGGAYKSVDDWAKGR